MGSLLYSEKTNDEGDGNNIESTFPESARSKRRSDGSLDFAGYWISFSIGHAAIGSSLWANLNMHMLAQCGAAPKRSHVCGTVVVQMGVKGEGSHQTNRLSRTRIGGRARMGVAACANTRAGRAGRAGGGESD